jgi:hypothetical protein
MLVQPRGLSEKGGRVFIHIIWFWPYKSIGGRGGGSRDLAIVLSDQDQAPASTLPRVGLLDQKPIYTRTFIHCSNFRLEVDAAGTYNMWQHCPHPHRAKTRRVEST